MFARAPKLQPLYTLAQLDCATVDGEDSGHMDFNGEGRLVERLAPRCRVAVDAGANVGLWTARAVAANCTGAV